jgi:rhodanese-related sulfurtransferase
MMFSKKILWLMALVLGVGLLAGCGDDDEDTPTAPTPVDQFEVVRSALDVYLSGSDGAVVTAQTLFDNMNDGDDTNDYVVVSVRDAADYAIGHIPGATNIPWREAGDTSLHGGLPPVTKASDPVLVYCYTGHTGGVVTTLFRALGYEAYNLKWGIMSWTTDPTIRVKSAFDEAADAHDFPTETTAVTPGTYTLPELNVTSSTDETAIILAAANEYLEGSDGAVITAQTLYDNINDGDDTNDYFVISVRDAADYAIGHIAGAINIPWREMTDTAMLAGIPTDQPICVYCYTGHTGAVATMTLRMLGYEAYNLKFGIMAWTTDPTVRVKAAFDEATDAHDFTTEP